MNARQRYLYYVFYHALTDPGPKPEWREIRAAFDDLESQGVLKVRILTNKARAVNLAEWCLTCLGRAGSPASRDVKWLQENLWLARNPPRDDVLIYLNEDKPPEAIELLAMRYGWVRPRPLNQIPILKLP